MAAKRQESYTYWCSPCFSFELSPRSIYAPFGVKLLVNIFMPQASITSRVYDNFPSFQDMVYRALSLLQILAILRDVGLPRRCFSLKFPSVDARGQAPPPALAKWRVEPDALPIIETQAGDVSAYIPTPLPSPSASDNDLWKRSCTLIGR